MEVVPEGPGEERAGSFQKGLLFRIPGLLVGLEGMDTEPPEETSRAVNWKPVWAWGGGYDGR